MLQTQISKWLKNAPRIRTIQDLETLICEKVKLVFEEVRNDNDLINIICKYLGLGEPIFATLKTGLDEKTFATLIERRKVDGNSRDRYVAVIDCRGPKAARRFFTRWHEIAHLLTLEGQLQLPLHRSTTDQSPTERLMDTIAGEIGFYDPFFQPILRDETDNESGLSFIVVERIRERFCPEASFKSTLNTCVKRFKMPTLVAEIGLGLKKEEERQIESPQLNLIPTIRPEPKLRVLSVLRNDVHSTGLKLHRNMQVPTASLLYRFFFKHDEFDENEVNGIENLNIWRHSDGQALANLDVKMQARRFQDSVIVLISPLNF